MSTKTGKTVIAILSDRSFYIRDIGVCIGVIADVFFGLTSDTVFVYGGNERINSHVEEYGTIYKLPKDSMINIPITDTSEKPFSRILVTKEYLITLEYMPDIVYIFRDMPNADTNELVNQCKLRRIPVVAINSNGDSTNIDKPFKHDTKVYYTDRRGF